MAPAVCVLIAPFTMHIMYTNSSGSACTTCGVSAGVTALERRECVGTITVSQLQLLLQLLLSSIPHTMPCSPAVLGCAALLVSKARLTHPLQRQRSVNRGQHKQLQQHHAPTPHHTDLIRCIIFNTSSSRSDHNSSSSGHNSCHSGVCPLPAVRLQCTEAAVGCSAACCDGPGHQG
jgi:hypothetical protein